MNVPLWLPAAVLGLALGTGLLLIFSSFVPHQKPTPAPTERSVSRLRKFLDESGHPDLRVLTLMIGTAACAGAVFVVIFTLTTAMPVALCFAVFGGLAPWGVLRWQLVRRRKLLAEVWPDVVDHLRSAVRSGLSMAEGLIELGHTGPEPIRRSFAEFGRDWRASVPMDTALERLKVRLADPVGDRIVLVLRMTRELGGTDLGKLLSTLSGVLRENARTRNELEARQSWTITGAKLAVAAPWVVVLLLSMRPEAAEAYRSGTGMLVLGAGLAVSAICYQLMLRIGALPAEERVLM